MQLLTAQMFILMAIPIGVKSELDPSDPHVCLKEETYQEKIQVKTKKPRDRWIKKLCWEILQGFQCRVKVVDWVDVMEDVMVPRSKLLPRCCEGYESRGTGCVPHCREGCFHGECIRPDVCNCHPGFDGLDCGKCLRGYWGENCTHKCDCINGRCNEKLGCICNSGWTGLKCESVCPDGYYGLSCKNECNCKRTTCHHVTGHCITTTTEASSSSITFTTATLTEFTPETEETSTSSTTHLHSVVRATSTEIYDTTEGSMTTSYLPNTEVFETSKSVDSKTDLVYEIKQTTKKDTDEDYSETVAMAEMKPSEAGTRQNTITIISKPTTETGIVGPENTTIKISREEDERETNLVNNEVTQSGTIFQLEPVNEHNPEKNKKNRISLTANKEDVDKTKKDNSIFEGKGNPDNETIFKFLQFFPSLSVISAASFLIVIIVGGWMIMSHRRKTRMLLVAAPKKGNISQPEDGVKFYEENLFSVNNCTVNPVYMSDIELNNSTPILQTFKPFDKKKEKRTEY